MNLVKPQSGHIFYQGIDITDPRQFAANKKLLQTSRQMIFQDSTSSLNGRMKVADIIAEPMRIAHMAPQTRNVPQGGSVSDEIRGVR